jgi:tetratricopeptide (TPR) repeat protein
MKELIFIFIVLISLSSNGQVRVYEGQEKIPTYKRGADVLSPVFYTGRGVQGAAGHMYPYPAQINLGDELTLETYNMVYLENEYLKVTILPEFGGRLFSATDKTNGRELFHRNSVIKPDLIGTLGAWISGGIEWCFPHHHRTSTLMPADYAIVENEDGSSTVWVGETERDLRLRGIIGITLRPDRSFIEVEYRLNNTNSVTKNFLFWANVAVTADDNFRTFWPPSQEIGVFHSNKSFTHWPLSYETYNEIDYTSGVDLTWWKNHPNPVSFFFWQGKEGFVGGYNYAQNAGTIHVGDVTENRTSKLWQFGPGLLGQNARRKLTDDGKAYVELMTGTFSNNQPGYGWFVPHSVKTAKNFWYPIRDLEIVKNANTNASVTLQIKDTNLIFYGFNTTKSYTNTQAILKYEGDVLREEMIDIDPSTPYSSTFQFPNEFNEDQLYVELLDNKGNKLVSYTPYKSQYPVLPAVQEPPKTTVELETVEDIYLTGRFIEQFSRPGVDADDYYLKALKISPDDYRVNMALGIRRVNQWRYEEAEMYLQKAADKLMVKYFQPKEGELFYYLGLAQKGLGKTKLAYENFSKSTWYYEWRSSGFYELALLECNLGNYTKALEQIEKARFNNELDGRILLLQTALLRKLGQKEKALEINQKQIAFDPINFAAYYEQDMLNGSHHLMSMQKNMQDVDNNYLEIATHYLNAGLLDEGIALLSSLENPGNPLVNFYLARFYSKKNQPEIANAQLLAAGNQSVDYCFPYREESIDVLKYAIDHSGPNAIPNYLLGNLLYDKRPEDAIKAWNNALEGEGNFAMVWRNLAFGAFYHENNADKAIEYQQKAIAMDGNQPIWFAELETYYDQSDKDINECIDILAANIETVKKDINAPKRLVKLYNLNGDYDKAIDLLDNHHFRTWELGKDIYYHYVDAHTLKALELMKEGKNGDAISELEKAMEYPENLEVGKPLNDERNAMIHYFIGLAYENLGDEENATKSFNNSIQSNNSFDWPDLPYYQARSYGKIGNEEKAREIYLGLIKNGDERLQERLEGAGTGVEENTNKSNKNRSEAYYIKALGSLGTGNKKEAEILFNKAIEIYKNNLWANFYANQSNF